MDDACMNHYEKQLYTVFKTFDVDNEEALDRAAVLQLCDALQLEARGAALVDSLFERSAERVTFATFRNGLLSVLGASAPAEPEPPPAEPAHSDDDSSGREVAPKFVFGSKKYGRRSRPARGQDSPGPRAASASRLDADAGAARSRMRFKRSASAMEARADRLDHDRRIDRAQAVALCRDLRMDSIDPRLVDRIFDDSPSEETTVGEFFDRLNSALTSLASASEAAAPPVEPPDPPPDSENEDVEDLLAGEAVAEAWERAGVRGPRRLLAELGFGGATLGPAELERALDEELRALAPARDERDGGPPLQVAALALSRLRRRRARARAAAAAAERDKLRADLAEANRRARLLAQDVDESHARLEAERQAALRQLEARHAEAARAAAADWAAERERAAAARAELEAELARRGDAEARLRAELAALRLRADWLESRAGRAEERAAAAERERARAEEEAREAAELGAEEARRERAAAAALEQQVRELRAETARLRDRADELQAGLEARAAPAAPAAPPAAAHTSWRDEAADADDALEECDSSPPSIEQRVMGSEEPSLSLVCPRCARTPAADASAAGDTVDAGVSVVTVEAGVSTVTVDAGVSAVTVDAGVSTVTVDAGVSTVTDEAGVPPVTFEAGVSTVTDDAGVSPVTVDAGVSCAPVATADAEAQTDAAPAGELELRARLDQLQEKHQAEKNDLNNLVAELESSLEALREEYERCEEYWAGKVSEERALAAEEAAAGDERLGELLRRVAEYEAAFRPRLPALPESSLEPQYQQLEQEFSAFKAEAERELAAVRAAAARELAAAREDAERARARACPCRQVASAASRPASNLEHQAGDGVESVSERRGGGAGGGAGAHPPLPHLPRPSFAHHDAEGNCRCAGMVGRLRLAAAGEAAGLRARAAHAERAAARLLARLHAADQLVAELYRENCQLQTHQPPHPPPRPDPARV